MVRQITKKKKELERITVRITDFERALLNALHRKDGSTDSTCVRMGIRAFARERDVTA